MSPAERMAADIERAAHLLDLSPSTAGALAGQGGQFYSRLKAGKRTWPETIEKARAELARAVAERMEARRRSACNASHEAAQDAEQVGEKANLAVKCETIVCSDQVQR